MIVIEKIIGMLINRIVYIYFKIVCAGTIEGLPNRSGFVLIANHASYLDGIILSEVMKKIGISILFFVKEKYASHPILRLTLLRNDYITVSNCGKKIVDMKNYRKMIKKNMRYIAIFPEGTRNNLEVFGTYKDGAGLLARRLGLPIQPVALVGFKNVLPIGKKIPQRFKCKIVFLPEVNSLEKGILDIKKVLAKEIGVVYDENR